MGRLVNLSSTNVLAPEMLQSLFQITTLSILLSSGLGAIATRHYSIVNKCPSPIDLFVNGESQGPLAVRATTTRDFDSSFDGFIYTTSNGGHLDGSHTTRAGFFGEVRCSTKNCSKYSSAYIYVHP